MFKPSKLLERTLNSENRDRKSIVSALIGYINADPYFETDDFDRACKYVESQGVAKGELYETLDKSLEYNHDEGAWTKDYYSLSRVFLKDNFSKERIEHVKKVAKKICPKTAVIQNNTKHVKESSSNNAAPKRQAATQTKPRKTNWVPIIATVAVVVAVVVVIFLLTKK